MTAEQLLKILKDLPEADREAPVIVRDGFREVHVVELVDGALYLDFLPKLSKSYEGGS